MQTSESFPIVCKPARSTALFANQMYCLQTHEIHNFTPLQTASVCKLNAMVCRFRRAHYIVFANQSSLQTAQRSAGTNLQIGQTHKAVCRLAAPSEHSEGLGREASSLQIEKNEFAN